ncbi:MAG TPA: hypothetical protein VK065_01230, partial [Brevibacterium sp.]|nr:hypothetical protein [Brevibacterium sp.]
LGVLGFAVMVGGGFWALSSGGGAKADPASSRPTGGTPGPSTGQGGKGPGFMDRMEDRWDKRRGGQ